MMPPRNLLGSTSSPGEILQSVQLLTPTSVASTIQHVVNRVFVRLLFKEASAVTLGLSMKVQRQL